MNSFFDNGFTLPASLRSRVSRRQFLKSAAATSALSVVSPALYAKVPAAQLNTDPYLTLQLVLEHLLPSSASGPGAKEIKAINYLYNVMHQQPTEEDEKQFILNGVGWLNGYTKSNSDKSFVDLDTKQKESALRAISKSRAGENWLSTLLSYIFEAMLSPPSYGGNPEGIGWKWLNHKPGFPLPKEGKRYYELPAYARIDVKAVDDSLTSQVNHKNKGKAV
ncbi:gluconate 2-dehydrogenase subunit 3 family protein [Thalassotalea crassostreae]|uniref:gluconate 2-dehydrogenase subunit 3 family protein n=1 Tax=Thalassotalea crassostreae TaxID=1763536 RepID=UPI000838467D|nr:gluconate 2-dehydrogenase subunit 3 family protein [Thalassotalea crassostreae]